MQCCYYESIAHANLKSFEPLLFVERLNVPPFRSTFRRHARNKVHNLTLDLKPDAAYLLAAVFAVEGASGWAIKSWSFRRAVRHLILVNLTYPVHVFNLQDVMKV